jgi:UPF0176 protein
MTQPATAHQLHSAFYRFATQPDPESTAAQLRAHGQALGLQGSVVVAAEGISGAVAGAFDSVASFERRLQQSAGQSIGFKHSACITAPFGRFKVVVKPEIVALGLPQITGLQPQPGLAKPDQNDASHVQPQAWRALLDRSDVVVLDNRNHFEYRLGHFRGAVDPQVHNFRDFVSYVEAHAPAWRAQSRPVAMYCTGGIRCDKTAPWLRSLGLSVLQLEGGVLNYFQEMADAHHDWLGECFVFDRRLALDTRLRETGTRAEQIYDPSHADEAWRLRRALQLDTSDGPQPATPTRDG